MCSAPQHCLSRLRLAWASSLRSILVIWVLLGRMGYRSLLRDLQMAVLLIHSALGLSYDDSTDARARIIMKHLHLGFNSNRSKFASNFLEKRPILLSKAQNKPSSRNCFCWRTLIASFGQTLNRERLFWTNVTSQSSIGVQSYE
jgi:hypothetical protein